MLVCHLKICKVQTWDWNG